MFNLKSIIKLSLTEEGRNVLLFKLIQGHKTLRLNYDLAPNSVVFDIGGYRGEWAKEIYSRYGCNILIFEPVREFVKEIKRILPKNKKVKIYNFGLAGITETSKIYINSDGTSRFTKRGKQAKAKFVDITSFIIKHKFNTINLMKINIEGGEYNLLRRLINTGLIDKIDNLQVQFHPLINNSGDKMSEIQKRLSKTHRLTYQYKFVWENWKKK